MNVKQERHDEAEINELAAKMIEAHKQQSAKQQQQQAPRAVGNQISQGTSTQKEARQFHIFPSLHGNLRIILDF
jgi:hypothetical protein